MLEEGKQKVTIRNSQNKNIILDVEKLKESMLKRFEEKEGRLG